MDYRILVTGFITTGFVVLVYKITGGLFAQVTHSFHPIEKFINWGLISRPDDGLKFWVIPDSGGCGWNLFSFMTTLGEGLLIGILVSFILQAGIVLLGSNNLLEGSNPKNVRPEPVPAPAPVSSFEQEFQRIALRAVEEKINSNSNPVEK